MPLIETLHSHKVLLLHDFKGVVFMKRCKDCYFKWMIKRGKY